MNDDFSFGVSLLSNSKKGIGAVPTGTGASEALMAQKKFDAKRTGDFLHVIPEFGQLFWKKLLIWLEIGEIKPVHYNVIKGWDADKVNAALDEYRDGKGGARYHVHIGEATRLIIMCQSFNARE